MKTPASQITASMLKVDAPADGPRPVSSTTLGFIYVVLTLAGTVMFLVLASIAVAWWKAPSAAQQSEKVLNAQREDAANGSTYARNIMRQAMNELEWSAAQKEEQERHWQLLDRKK